MAKIKGNTGQHSAKKKKQSIDSLEKLDLVRCGNMSV